MNPTEIKRVLVCDDDATFRNRLARSLRGRGLVVFESSNAQEGLATAEEFGIDSAVVDLRMTGESGLWLVQKLKELSSEIRVVVLTGFGSIVTALEAVRLGAVNYLTKPTSADALLNAFFPQQQPVLEEPVIPSLEEVEREYVQRVLDEHQGNISRTAKALGLHRRSLQRKLGKSH